MFQITALFCLLAGPVSAPPVVGRPAPEFTLKTLEGEAVSLSQRTSRGAVVLIVLRGFPGYQCPICTRQVNELVRESTAFEAAGARVMLVYPGPSAELQARAKEFAVGKNLPSNFDFLLDPDYSFTLLYGLRWDAPKETAYPSAFIVGRAGKVAFAKISKTHGGRASAAELLVQLRSLK